ncbi:MAG: Anthranilate phosphoribosyltransferase [Acetothermia bacterium 64_32]|nr:MAG: Anthranilate phosphoribosyltransferase [Acetothermia bacterium 64_32]HAF69744.1 anthranilate phosphoribosyltransferase [Candidatus Acetothermia bacterium]
MKEALASLAEGRHLGEELAAAAMHAVMGGRATPAQIGAFLMGLATKGETAEELAAMARVMRDHALRIAPEVHGPLLDLCGTGGAPVKTFNVSTTASFVAASCGVAVAKHGNRSSTGRCGSADLLEALGLDLSAPRERVKQAIERVGIGFLFAPVFHPAMRHAAGPRRELGIRTAFNLLGPLTNPAGATAQLLGVSSPRLVELFPQVLRLLGVRRALVAWGTPGVDEITLTGETQVGELSGGELRGYRLRPEAYGLGPASPEEVGQLPPPQAAACALAILKGEDQGPRYEMVLLNAAAALYVADRAPSIEEGLSLAQEAIRSGAAYGKLREFFAYMGDGNGRAG